MSSLAHEANSVSSTEKSTSKSLLNGIMKVVEPIAALLVLLEVIILSAGIIARYIFNSPLTWSDELASIVFIWLVMLGAVIALGRGEHMRLGMLLAKVSENTRGILEAVGSIVIVILLGMLVPYSISYTEHEWTITTPALEISDGIRVLSLAVGMSLMTVVSLVRLKAQTSMKNVLLALAIVAVIAGGLWLAKPLLMSIGNFRLLVFFVLLLGACVLAGIPIAFSFGVATVAHLSITTRVPLEIMIGRMDEGMSHLILLSIPMFVILGLIMEMTGVARALINFMMSLIGHVRGGLSYVLLGAMYLVSGISGSKAADMAAVGPMLFPEMRKRGAKSEDLVAQLAASGAMSETIPPSFVLIIMGSVTGVSISALFTGGLLPALIAALALAAVCAYKSKGENLATVEKAKGRVVLKGALVALPAIALPFLIRAAVVEGVATATEVSTIGIAYCLVMGLVVYDGVQWKRIYPMLVDTACLSGSILTIMGMATGMAWALTQSGFSTQLANFMTQLPGGAFTFMLVSILLFLVLGSLLEGIPAIVLFGPLMFPIARQLGIHEVHYAIVAVLAMGVGLFAPPFGVGFYAACAIGRVPPETVMKHIWPYLASIMIATLVIATVPWLSIGFLK